MIRSKYLCMLHLQSSNIVSETLTDNKRNPGGDHPRSSPASPVRRGRPRRACAARSCIIAVFDAAAGDSCVIRAGFALLARS